MFTHLHLFSIADNIKDSSQGGGSCGHCGFVNLYIEILVMRNLFDARLEKVVNGEQLAD